MRVRAIAPFEYRMARITEAAGEGEPPMEKQLLEWDAEQASFIRRVYGKDINDPEGYDLVLNRVYASVANRNSRDVETTLELMRSLESRGVLCLNSYSSCRADYSKAFACEAPIAIVPSRIAPTIRYFQFRRNIGFLLPPTDLEKCPHHDFIKIALAESQIK